MNTSANTDQMHDATIGTARATGMGTRRRSMAGALLATTIGATAVDRAFDPHVHCDYRFDDRFPCDWR
jgi:hypothetical protein